MTPDPDNITIYSLPYQLGTGWYFKRMTGPVEFIVGPYPDEMNAHQNLERLRRDTINSPVGGPQQNFQNQFDSASWRSTVRDIFGPNSIEGYPTRGSRG